jgi:predicted Zn-dependent protease
MKLAALLFLSLLNPANAGDMTQLRWQSWDGYVPNIVVCNGADVDQEALKEAVDNWRARGERIGKIVRKSCGEYPDRGDIAIYENNERQTSSQYGVTSTNVFLDADGNQTEKIFLARIWIKSNYLDSRILLEHEIGHGLGFRDTSDMNSIMARSGPIY